MSAKPDAVGLCVTALDADRRTVWIVDAHRDGKRFIVRADGKLTAFVQLEAASRAGFCGYIVAA